MTLRVAWRALMRNKMRTLLTMLGIIIGVAAVIAMLSVGNGARMSVENQISKMGTNTIMFFPGSTRRGGIRTGQGTRELTLEDWQAVQTLPNVAAAAPVMRGDARVIYGAQNWPTQYYGTTSEFFYVRNWPAVAGRTFTTGEVQAGAAVAVLGKTTADNLFGAADPVGEVVRVGSVPCEVVGVMLEKGEGRDDLIVIPYTLAQRRMQRAAWLNQIVVSARYPDRVQATQDQVMKLLRQRHRVADDDEDAFFAFNQAEVSRTAGETTRVFALLLGSIASVSLLVGGIGIMNIMLVSVTERIREIGIRMAVGARARDILLQFLVEAVVLSLIGGLIGVMLGVGIAVVLAGVFGWPTGVSHVAILLSFTFSGMVGIFFGFYPALQASRLDPIQALRHE
ncbi:MAG: ABC transporter permease [Candidatus Eremiobacterota bacterium]